MVDGHHSLKWTKLCFFKSGSEINLIHTCQRVSSCTTAFFFPSPGFCQSGILENSFSFSYSWICRLTGRLPSESHFVTLGVRLCQGKLWDHGATTVYDNNNNIIIIVRVIITLPHMLLCNPKSRPNGVFVISNVINLCRLVAFIHKVCTTGVNGDVMTSWRKVSRKKKNSEPRRYFARQTPPFFFSLLSRLVMCEWEKTREKCSAFQLGSGQSSALRLVRGPSICAVCNVRVRAMLLLLLLLSLKAQKPCNHVMSNLVEVGGNKGKKACGDLNHNNQHGRFFAIDPYVMSSVEQEGVATGLRREFLASTPEWADDSGQYLSSSRSTCLVRVSIYLNVTHRLSRTPLRRHRTQHNASSVLLRSATQLPCSYFIVLIGAIAFPGRFVCLFVFWGVGWVGGVWV